ncbi:antibiotic biosynthesis monooxygenase [Saccharothrix variisporea]|uniref:Antibiotic biosynthesis monooxygenase n=1 Tax=Saccharothrix variisporea TaxID=543527 RepID=A0A495X442_9PSEU|nr:antibiotic biosynthesis monooxygenase [Saccharothrix variisporea]RKT67403.1 antibiotic biosynthesis monooxygenase [Saccharothrix variisporea]
MRPDLAREDADVLLVAPFADEFDDRPAGLVASHRLVGTGGSSDGGSDGEEVTVAQFDAVVSREGFTAYRRYRSLTRSERVPGCVVLVRVELAAGTGREWVDLVLDALAHSQDLPPGGISGHFHVSDDGSKVLNYAEWESAAAHVEAVERGGGSVGVGERWERVHGFHGLKSSTVRRYRYADTGDHGQGL